MNSKEQKNEEQRDPIYEMKLHEIIEIYEPPYYRIMRVASGWLYDFYDAVPDNYQNKWIFVPFDNSFQ